MNLRCLFVFLACPSFIWTNFANKHGIVYLNGHGHHAVDNRLGVETKALAIQDDLRLKGTLEEDGRVCVKKVSLSRETVYQEMMVCDHKNEKRCHDTYKTVYVPHQEEECDEKFRKNCVISYEDVARNEEVEECKAQFVDDCTKRADDECRTVFDTQCSTSQKEHEVEDSIVNCVTEYEEKCEIVTLGLNSEEQCDSWPVEKCNVVKKKVKKYRPDTKCIKEPREVCTKGGCALKEGPLACATKIKAVVSSVPVEECEMSPQKICRQTTKLVPQLEPQQECVDVPREVCAMSKVNPKTVMRPMIQKFCYSNEWKMVFSHNTTGGLFSSTSALSKNEDNPSANLYSILGQLKNVSSPDGYHLKLCYPELKGVNGGDGCNEWIQTSNPVSASTITGFKAIKLSFTRDGNNNAWRGIGKNGYSQTLIDDTPGHDTWYTQIGAASYSSTGKIYGPRAYQVTKVVLYFKKVDGNILSRNFAETKDIHVHHEEDHDMDVMHETNSMEVVEEIDLGKDEMTKQEMQKIQEMNAMEADYEIEEVIRLRKVVFSSQSCDGCNDDILSVTLHGAPNHGHKGYECMFEQNPQPFYNDSKITFDNAAELGECWEAPMDGDLLPGGKVVLSGEGKWNLGDMCVEWDDQDANLWKCQVVLASVRSENVGKRTYILNCDKIFDEQVESCNDVL